MPGYFSTRLFVAAVGSFSLASVAAACGGSTLEVSPQVEAALLALAAPPPPELSAASEAVVSQCMREKGFEYTPAATSQESDGEANLAGVMGLRDERAAEKEGYGSFVVRRPSTNPGQAPLTQFPPGYGEALEGSRLEKVTREFDGGLSASVSGGGCSGEGWKRVYGMPENYLRLSYAPQGIRKFSRDIVDDDAVGEAWGGYESCMAGSGYQGVKTVKYSMNIARERFERSSGEPPSPEERTMAVADARCQRESGVVQAMNGAVLRVGAQWIKEHEAEVVELADIQNQSLSRAKAILENG